MIGALSFAAPAVLAGILVLPALYFILRAMPPAPRRQVFPPIRLLRMLAPTAHTPVRMPLWLLLLRLVAAALLIVGFAGPQIVPPPILAGRGPVLLAIDNGWASAADFAARQAAARRIADEAGRRGVILLSTARAPDGKPPRPGPVLGRDAALAAIGGLHPEPWPADRRADEAAARAARRAHPGLTAVYVADGLAAPGLDAFLAALRPERIVTGSIATLRLLDDAGTAPDGAMRARVRLVPRPAPVSVPVLAEDREGDALARAIVTIRPDHPTGTARIDLPFALQARVSRLVIPGEDGAAAVALLGGASRQLLVGLAAGGTADAEQRFTGELYYVRRALPQGARRLAGSLVQVIGADPGALILADVDLRPEAVARLRRYIAAGGVVIRFAGPLTASRPDKLNPDKLLPGIRDLSGPLAGGHPETIAAFAPDSPLAGLKLPLDAHIRRLILPDPAQLAPASVWARLADGTPIILGQRLGRGALVDVLTTANPDWSDLPLSAAFPALIRTLVHLGAGGAPSSGRLALVRALDGAGRLIPPAAAAKPLDAARMRHVAASPEHPPGLWGDTHGTVALNLAGHVPKLAAASWPALVPVTGLDAVKRARRFGPDILAAAMALLLFDMLATLWLRGALRIGTLRIGAILGAVSLCLWPSCIPHARAAPPEAALNTTLAYVRADDPATDRIVRAGLAALTAAVNAETAAVLGPPRGVVPGRDDLDLYPLLYWRITSRTRPPTPPVCAALDAFMRGGGLLVIDTDGGDAGQAGSGAGFDPGAQASRRRVTSCLSLPPLRPLTDRDTLAHTFFLLRSFPGRFDGAPVYIAVRGGRDADGVSPVVIGANDWAGAWALGADGTPLFALLPGMPGQRQAALRVGVNLVMYALTGTYKADQLQIPAILQRLGE
ncbi:MAG TPA: DUF4159 domain-containing protein [Acidiphilium sp.]|uniref:DUF4159 domain-containing protein n=1 Tax=unclassified Acidiphilium TaxID=2617493 RepID=UPI000BC51704|nr:MULTISPECIES: DUF4159 domain-containing protein [unclassified Acidiphilium]OYV55388.1 MAG: hypothetical protein B7Z76_10625 [Acidiphilium sp. 20-67-58]HQT61876.1 DUF4159 domain-containing protein [Acidiphilium sp.]HQU10769.1 DUF4159 domain-containing protein [Acidiphilium sp.]